MARTSYKTKTKEIVNEAIKKFPNGATIKELKEFIEEENENVGLTTIYRALDESEKNGIVKKYFDDNNIAHYKYVNECMSRNHFYLKCDKCNKMIHIDCSCIDEFQAHVLKQHGFTIDAKNVILSGICSECRNFIKL